MRTETVTYYCCGYCNSKYSTEEEACACELLHRFDATDPDGSKPKYNRGDLVYEVVGVHRVYFVLDEGWVSYWDTEKKCWIYGLLMSAHTSIPEDDIRLAMPASEYNRRVQDIKDKLGEDYTIDIRPYSDQIGFHVDLEPKGVL